MNKVKIGLERFVATPPEWSKNNRLGLLCNPASVDSQYRHARHLIKRCFPEQLLALFSPQHGFFAEKQDNMIESENLLDPDLNIPVYSLYGKTREPTREMMDAIDVLIIDLPDVGTRVYTFIYTLSYCLEAAKKYNKKVIVLDRPNPINGLSVEGNCLNPEWASFVGRYPIPMRHGLTIGEIARLFNDRFGIGCDLEVIPMQGWQRQMLFSQTGLPWLAPSPNLPTPASALVYPGQVIWEGTNVSEGRGTTQPFEFFGAPFIDIDKILTSMGGNRIPGAVLRPVVFEPTANKWQQTRCYGFQIHVTEPGKFQPYRTSLRLLQAVIKNHKKRFRWKHPPYEYEYEKLPIDLIIGDQTVRRRLENMDDIDNIEQSWKEELEGFKKTSSRYRLY